MVAVNVVDGIKYGFRLIGYLVAVVVVAAILAAVGQAFMPSPLNEGGNIVLAGVFYLGAVLVYTAGFLGLLYKVIADGVEIGTLSAEAGGGAGALGGLTDVGPGGGAGQPPQGQSAQPQGQPGGPPGQPPGGQRGAREEQAGGRSQNGEGGRGGGRQGEGNQPPEDWEPGN